MNNKKRDPAAAVVQFFQEANLDAAQTVLAICKSIVARRQPVKGKITRPRALPTDRAAGSSGD